MLGGMRLRLGTWYWLLERKDEKIERRWEKKKLCKNIQCFVEGWRHHVTIFITLFMWPLYSDLRNLHVQ